MNIIWGKIRGSKKNRPIAVDAMSNLLISIEPEHAAIHDGIHYVVEDFVSIANGGSASIIIETPAFPTAHFVFEIYAVEGICDIELRESATANVDGTALTPRNNNRISTNTSALVFRLNPTGLVDGTTLLSKSRTGSGNGPTTRVGGNIQHTKEYILKPSTKYQIKFTNQAGINNTIGWSINYYEYVAYN